MKIKKAIYSLFALILLIGLWSEMFLSESINLLRSNNKKYQSIISDQNFNKKKEDHNYYKDGLYGIMLDQVGADSQIDNENTVNKSNGNEFKSELDSNTTAITSRGETSSSKYNAEDLYWLAKIIEAEAKGEPYHGKVAVGNVILNRVDSDEFPDTIYDVIFEYHGSIPQFSPVDDGSIHNTPSRESIRAAKDAVNGVAPVGDAIYFFNPSKASGAWIVNNRSYIMTIGAHNFYR